MNSKIDESGSQVVVSETEGKNPDGSEARRVWSLDVEQAEKHLPQFSGISKGQAAAIRDAANEFRKEKAKRDS